MTLLWKEAGADGEVTDLECSVGLGFEVGFEVGGSWNAPGFMAFEDGPSLLFALLFEGRMSAKPFWKDAVLPVRARDWWRIGRVCSS